MGEQGCQPPARVGQAPAFLDDRPTERRKLGASHRASAMGGIPVVSIGSLPLSKFTVLDLTHARAGPTAVRQFADWGAKVIKIEPPGAAATEITGSRRAGFDFQNLHRNKRSLSLNLKSKEGLAIFMKMAEKADVIVENFKS